MLTPIPTIFLPALLCNEQLYRGVIEMLNGRIDAQVLVSSKPRIADSVVEILERAPSKFALVGTSYGGTLAMEVALTAPERVTSLWLMGCDPGAWPPGSPDLAGGLQANPDAVIGRLSELAVYKGATAASASLKSMAQAVGATAGAIQARAQTARSDIRGRLKQLTMPALLLWGQDDALVPLSTGQALAKALPHAHFEQLPECGHLPTLEKPVESAALFGAFLRARYQQSQSGPDEHQWGTGRPGAFEP